MKYLLLFLLVFPVYAQDEPVAVIETPGDNISNEEIHALLIELLGRLNATQPEVRAAVVPPDEPVLGLTSPERIILPQEARASGLYKEEGANVLPVTTRVYEVPAGFTIERIPQQPQYVITEYAQPDIFKAVPIPQPVQIQPAPPPTVGQGNVDSITIITEGDQ